MFLAALDQFFSRAGRCFPDLLLRVGLLFVRGVHAVARPVIAVEVFRGGALAANGTATIISALVVVAVRVVVLRVTRPGALFFRGVTDVALAFAGGRRSRRGRVLRAANPARATAAAFVTLRTRVLGATVARASVLLLCGRVLRVSTRSTNGDCVVLCLCYAVLECSSLDARLCFACGLATQQGTQPAF